MNLLFDPWIEVIRKSGRRERIAPVELTANTEDPALDVVAPRPDFRGAIYQFLIGLLQTACAPEDLNEWCERWEEPLSAERLSELLKPYASAFELDARQNAFMQDGTLPEEAPNGIASLLIDTPGAKTERDNNDHFIHAGSLECICPACAAAALFTMQINAPGGGVGHRVSLRGGGPLTTLRIPRDEDSILWRIVWMNVLPGEALNYGSVNQLQDVLPWVGPIRTSNPKAGGVDTTPESVHCLQAYWSMPRRIHLDFAKLTEGRCNLCAAESVQLLRQYYSVNYGVNYTGAWLHPLTPYSFDAKNEKPPLPIKGQPGGIGYRHWLGLTLGDEQRQPEAAQVVRYFVRYAARLPESARDARLWCFGYDMDNMKARCWYDATLPMYPIPAEQIDELARTVKFMLDVASESVALLHGAVKEAWFKRPGNVGSEPAVHQGFWQATERAFYARLRELLRADLTDEAQLAPIYEAWLRDLRLAALRQFDQWVLAVPIEEGNMARVIAARVRLEKMLWSNKAAKKLQEIVNSVAKEQA